MASRQAIEKGVASLALIKIQIKIAEKEIIKIQNPRNDSELAYVLSQLYNDSEQMVDSVKVRVEAIKMDNILNYIKVIVVAVGTGITWLLGSWDTALGVLILLMVLDYGTGLLRAYINKEVSSDIGLKGIARKAVIFVMLIVAVMLDRLLNTGTWVFRTLVAYFYIANEGISLLENCAGLGLPIPEKIKDALVQLKDGEKKELNN